MATEVRVPTLGESVTEATVASWFKKAGDAVKRDEMLCELETDKVTVEAPSPVAGVLKEIIAEEGATVEADGLLCYVEEGAEASGDGEKAAAHSSPGEETSKAETPPPDGSPRRDTEDAPSAKKAMAEKGLSRDDVTGSGRDGRVMKEDVAKAGAKASAVPKPQGEREERVKMTRLRQTIARR